MSVVEPTSDLAEEAARVRDSGVLGRSAVMRRLFDFLASRAEVAAPVREIDLAVEVFGRTEQLDLSSDASVRVYIHRLRRRLEEHYERHGPGPRGRLSVPSGAYRLVFTPTEQTAAAPRAPAPPALPRWRRTLGPALAGLVGLALLTGSLGLAWAAGDRGWLRTGGVDGLRRTPFWAPAVDDDRPVLLVLGDYFMLGDTEGGDEVQRLVRQFDINSSAELDQFLASQPDQLGRLVDVELQYVPTGGASALRRVAPVLTSRDGRRGARLVLASQLTPAMTRGADIVYIGLFSGMGVLQETVFSGSRYRIGDNFDELVGPGGEVFVSQANRAIAPSVAHRDYGYLASFNGPDGNRIVVVAGMRDVGLMQAAEFATRLTSMRELERGRGRTGVEALYRVEALSRTNTGGQLLASNSR